MSAARKAEAAGAPTARVNEPQADWVPLGQALYYCSGEEFDTSVQNWGAFLIAEAQRIVSRFHIGAPPPNLVGVSAPEWRFGHLKKGFIEGADETVFINTPGVATQITPGSIYIFRPKISEPASRDADWLIGVGWFWTLPTIFDASEWDREVTPTDRIEAEWHRRLLSDLVLNWRDNFRQSVRSGAARTMARRTILGAFEPIAWDQWQFFELDKPPAETKSKLELREPYWDLRRVPATATGPSGERLYSIYVAPGIRFRETGQTAEQKCQQWLLGLMRDCPNRPKPLDALAREAVSLFPGLPKRGFQRAYLWARTESGNENWSKSGRPKNSQHKSQQQR